MAAMQQQRAWDIEDRDESRQYSRQVYSHLVQDAEAAGFNPLTALRNGGGASYNAAAGFAPLSRKAPVMQATSSGVGEAISGFGDFLSNFDPHADTKRELEYDLIKSQIGALNASALSDTRNATTSYASSRIEGRSSGQSGKLTSNTDLAKAGSFEKGDVKVTNPFHKNSGLEVNPYLGDAAAYEERWGEVGGAIIGLGNMAADVWRNAAAYGRKGENKKRGFEIKARRQRTGGGGGW